MNPGYVSSDARISHLHLHVQSSPSFTCALPAVDATVTPRTGQEHPANHTKPQHDTSQHFSY